MSKILIADDNKQIADVLAKFVAKEGMEAIVASDGEMALQLFAKHAPDIVMVLLDVMMPKKDGFEVCKTLRRDTMVPIIMITARDEDYDRIMALPVWGASDGFFTVSRLPQGKIANWRQLRKEMRRADWRRPRNMAARPLRILTR